MIVLNGWFVLRAYMFLHSILTGCLLFSKTFLFQTSIWALFMIACAMIKATCYFLSITLLLIRTMTSLYILQFLISTLELIMTARYLSKEPVLISSRVDTNNASIYYIHSTNFCSSLWQPVAIAFIVGPILFCLRP